MDPFLWAKGWIGEFDRMSMRLDPTTESALAAEAGAVWCGSDPFDLDAESYRELANAVANHRRTMEQYFAEREFTRLFGGNGLAQYDVEHSAGAVLSAAMFFVDAMEDDGTTGIED